MPTPEELQAELALLSRQKDQVQAELERNHAQFALKVAEVERLQVQLALKDIELQRRRAAALVHVTCPSCKHRFNREPLAEDAAALGRNSKGE